MGNYKPYSSEIEQIAIDIDQFVRVFNNSGKVGTYSKKLRSYLSDKINRLNIDTVDLDMIFTDEVECEHYEYQQMPDDADEVCNKGIGIENCGHCIFNKKLRKKADLLADSEQETKILKSFFAYLIMNTNMTLEGKGTMTKLINDFKSQV